MKKLIVAVALLAACTSKPATRPTPTLGPGAVTARDAVAGFMTAVSSQDLQALSRYWGTSAGPVRDRGDIPREELEKRELLMMCYLHHDRYRVLTDAPATNGERVLAVELTSGPLTRTTNFHAVVGPAKRWFVQSVDLDPVADICRQRR